MNSAAAVPSALPFSSLYEPCHTMVSHTVVSRPLPPPTTTTIATAPVKALSQTPPARLTFRTLTVALYQQKGLAGFYAGAFPALIQIVPYMGLNFAIYDWLTTPTRTTEPSNNNMTKNSSGSVVSSAYAGSISGALSKLVVYPLDTVKRRLQAQALVLSTDGISSNNHFHQCYRGMWDCFVTIYRREGYAAFYRGMVPSVLKTTISTSLSFALYRWTRNALASGQG